MKVQWSGEILSLIEQTLECEELDFYRTNDRKVEDLRVVEDPRFGYQRCNVQLEYNHIVNKSMGDLGSEAIMKSKIMVEAKCNHGGGESRRCYCVKEVMKAMELGTIENAHMKVMYVKGNVDEITMKLIWETGM